jgi:hypothetical protein
MKTTLSRLTILATIATAANFAQAAPLTNGGFESGSASWTESGGSGLFSTPATLAGFYASINPSEGTKFGLISNSGVATETISQTFDITDNYLTFSYRFTTDEHDNGPGYNDFARALLTIGVNPATTLLTVSRNDVQPGGIGSLAVGATYFDTTLNGYDIGQDGWRTATVNVAAFIGQSATLAFEVNNVDGTNTAAADDFGIGVSQLAVDEVHTAAVPEPTAPALLVSALGWLGLMRSRRATWSRRS